MGKALKEEGKKFKECEVKEKDVRYQK